jgi:lipopolysaccharide transport system permease protein
MAWILSSLGVYLRDIGQITGIFTTALLFLSPVFYPATALPPQYHKWLRMNPLTFIIEEARNTLIFGKTPNMTHWSFIFGWSLTIAYCGFVWFQKTRKGFSDVL